MANKVLIAMNRDNCSFKKFSKELEEYGVIEWEIPVKPKGDEINKNRKLVSYINEGDTIYFYVTHLPKIKSRILFKGIVKNGPYVTNYNNVYKHENNQEDPNITAFTIGNLYTLPEENLKDSNVLGKDELSLRFNEFYPRGKIWPNLHNGKLSTDLIDILDSSLVEELASEHLTLLSDLYDG